MKAQLKLSIVILVTILNHVNAAVEVVVGKEEIVIREGKEVNLTCTINSTLEALGCSFISPGPENKNYNMLKGAAYEQGRIQQLQLGDNVCAARITEIREKESGKWSCSVTTKYPDNTNYEIGTASIDVTVAIPPVEVFLRTNGERVNEGHLEINLDAKDNLGIDCVATGSKPNPEFSWYIGENPVDGIVTTSETGDEDATITHISTLTYAGKFDDFGKMLKCKITHSGYDEQKFEGQSNWVEAKLNLQFKPNDIQRLDGGDFNTVSVKFRANPEPADGKWQVGEEIIHFGKKAKNDFRSSVISPVKPENSYYLVNFTYTAIHKFDEKTLATLTLTNEMGTSTKEFKLLPKTSSMSMGVIVSVIVVTVIIVLGVLIFTMTRMHKIWCFSGDSNDETIKNNEDDDPEVPLTPNKPQGENKVE